MTRPETTENQRAIKRRAVSAANARMRSEILAEALKSRLKATEVTIDPDLAGGWNPFMLDPFDGFEAVLKTEDPLAMEVMKNPGLLARARGIMREELGKALFNSEETPALYQTILEDLVAPKKDSYYRAEEGATWR